MPTLSPIAQKVTRLKQIADKLPGYAATLAASPHSWLTPAYVAEHLAPAEAATAAYAASEAAVATLSGQTTTARSKLQTLATGAGFAVHALQVWQAAALSSLPAVSFGHDLEVKTRLLIDFLGSALAQTAAAADFLDCAKVKSALEAALATYQDLASQLGAAEKALQAAKTPLAEQLDTIDDLYYNVANALEGLFHEDRTALVDLMPWRARRSVSVVGVASVETGTATV